MVYCIPALGELVVAYVLYGWGWRALACMWCSVLCALCTISFCCIVMVVPRLLCTVFVMLSVPLSRCVAILYTVLPRSAL